MANKSFTLDPNCLFLIKFDLKNKGKIKSESSYKIKYNYNQKVKDNWQINFGQNNKEKLIIKDDLENMFLVSKKRSYNGRDVNSKTMDEEKKEDEKKGKKIQILLAY